MITEHPDYFKGKFDKIRAIIDLQLMAAYEDGEQLVNGKPVMVRRGQVATTTRQLAKRWNVDHATVMRWFSSEFDAPNIAPKYEPINAPKKRGAYILITFKDYVSYGEPSKKNINSDAPITAPIPAPIPAPHIKEYKEYISLSAPAYTHTYEGDAKFFEQARSSAEWIEAVCMNHQLKPADFERLMGCFELDWKAGGASPHKDLTDLKKHFNSWLHSKLEIKSKLENLNNRSNGDKRQTAGPERSLRVRNADEYSPETERF